VKLTLGVPAHSNEVEVWFTLQALRLYHDLTDTELLVVDNGGTDAMKKAVKDCRARYERYTDVVGAGPSKNRVFEVAEGEFVVCMDSHVLLFPGSVVALRKWLDGNWEEARNLIHGPMSYSGLEGFTYYFKDEWKGNQWGRWGSTVTEAQLPTEPVEVDMMASGLLGCRKDSWLGFHKDCRGFGGIEGVIQRKYQAAGRKALCLPFLKWVHCFLDRPRHWPLLQSDKVRNYELGLSELGMEEEIVRMREHFGVGRNKIIMTKDDGEIKEERDFSAFY